MEKLWQAPENELLVKQLMELSIYELDRLEKCFNYEYRIHPEKSMEITDILDHIKAVRQRKYSQLTA